jgi:hypothetical protein
MNDVIAAAGEWSGVYHAHWEAPYFDVAVGKGLLGRPRNERWAVSFPPDFELPGMPDLATWRHSSGLRFSLRVRGHLLAKGHYGHRGLAVRQIDVAEVLECERLGSSRDIRQR